MLRVGERRALRREADAIGVEALLKRRVARIHVRGEIGAVIRDVPRQIRAEHRDAEAAAELARQIDQPGRLLRLLRLQAAEGDVVDRREQQAERRARG